VLTANLPTLIPVLLRQALGPNWEFTNDGDRIQIQHPHRGTPYRPPRRGLDWVALLTALEEAFAAHGVPRAACLPLRWGRETELTISAVQALDPLLKEGKETPYRQGFLPQPVVRLTGDRDAHGALKDGILTSFVNVSRVQPIQHPAEYASVFDEWLTVLSRLGLHARHITFHGRLTTWRRREVEGITLRFSHCDLALGDIVLLWNADNPARMAVDLGTALERLAWAQTRAPWTDLIFGPYAHAAPAETLDAIRTATLLLGHGITPAARGSGSITRRVLSAVSTEASPLGFSAMIRHSHSFWSRIAPLPVPWSTATQTAEHELYRT
jgi:hypothetical protein